MCLFGSTFKCEQFFSLMKIVKSNTRNRISDKHLTSSLRIACSTYPADIDAICKNKIQHQRSH